MWLSPLVSVYQSYKEQLKIWKKFVLLEIKKSQVKNEENELIMTPPPPATTFPIPHIFLILKQH